MSRRPPRLITISCVFAAAAILVFDRAQTQSAALIPRSFALSGSLTAANRHSIVERTFAVPAGTWQIDLDVSRSNVRGAALDLGVKGPAGLRGWSENRLGHVHI